MISDWNLRAPKTALLCEGGGQLGVYGVGVLQCFHDHGVTFPYYIGVSAAAANLASHLAGHRNRTLRFYAQYAARSEYIGWTSLARTGNFVNLEYIYKTISAPGGEDPINFDVLCALEDEFRVVVTNARTGQAQYLGNEHFCGRELRVLMASCCLPVYCKPIEIDGELYFDGGCADSLPVAQALRDGCERVVAILNRPAGFIKQPERFQAAYGLSMRRYPAVAAALRQRHVTYMQSLRQLEDLEREGRAVLIRPQTALPLRTFTRKPRALLEHVCAMGYADGERLLGHWG